MLRMWVPWTYRGWFGLFLALFPCPAITAESVAPGINREFLRADLDVEEWAERFQAETREVVAARNEIMDACRLRAGMRVADVGAGTGFFTMLLADRVGEEGWVFAVEINTGFLEHISGMAREAAYRHVSPVLGFEDAICLPPESVDLVFVCDTYHHFEYPAPTLASIYRALRPGGVLVIVDFERIPGESSPWILNHVRAGKEVFTREIEEAGFRFEREVKIPQFEISYLRRFVKP